MPTKKYSVISLAMLIVVAFYLVSNLSTYSSLDEALNHQKEVKKIIELVRFNRIPQYAFFWNDNNQVAVASIHKGILGWKIGLITNSFKIQDIPFNSGIVGFARHGNLLYGIINSNRIETLKLDDTRVILTPLRNSYKLWYLTETNKPNNTYKSHEYKAYDKNNKLVHQITM